MNNTEQVITDEQAAVIAEMGLADVKHIPEDELDGVFSSGPHYAPPGTICGIDPDSGEDDDGIVITPAGLILTDVSGRILPYFLTDRFGQVKS